MAKRKKDLFSDFLKQKNLRVTGERLKLLRGVSRQRGHFNVDGLVRRLQKEGLKVSRDTVYRNLPILLDAGVIEQSFKTSRDTFYEAAEPKKHHDHLYCRNCEGVVEFRDPVIEKLQEKIAKRAGFKVEFHCHQIMGLCKKCQK
ncbi:MAG TPA: Fur family transcriptional regulator [Candidatus Omnitrophota bacterium]|jgi:Fur family ferric uptake transcriptional regulator|nr:MAG: Ferric uptake regulation protein [Candidatus Omnitrophica bacterium ADurb.Bin314]HOE69324.1 Fur family transcriptional regulator [Candidatus Omnitrophota bacterium]HQB93935.1 Fur family transcriptional regulator [Candidatus Omnitrophota bacterium]